MTNDLLKRLLCNITVPNLLAFCKVFKPAVHSVFILLNPCTTHVNTRISVSIVLQRRIFSVIAEDDLLTFHSALGVLMMARPDLGAKRDNN